MTLPVWVFLAKEWLKKNWKWLLLPLGLFVWLLGRAMARKSVSITSTALAEADAAKAGIEEKAAGQRQAVDAKEAAQLASISAQHSAAVAAETTRQINAAEHAQGDPERVNDLLLQVGKDMRK